MTHASASEQGAARSAGDPTRGYRPLAQGTVLEGRYQVQRILGRGGMSTVYAARDLRFSQVERICAIKEMADADPDPGTRALRLVNFERESALLATLNHAAVPKIYDYFSQGGLVYLVIEYVDGQDLERALQQHKLPFPEESLIQWTLEISSVLRMLHDNQPDPIIFRDLKPSNIMLRTSGHIALIDFGIARMFQSNQRGTMVGTEGYAPPEQYRGIADARGDIYALGATLHHLTTASDPRQETPFTFHDRPIRALNPEISEEFAAIVNKMVAYHPDQRYQHIEDVEDALRRLQRTDFDGEQPAPAVKATTTLDEPPSRDTPQTTIFTGAVPAAPARPLERKRASRKRAIRRRAARGDQLERVAWSLLTGDEVRGSGAFVGTGVAIGSYDNYVYCVNPEDGELLWKFPTGRGVVARPARAHDLMIVGSEDRMLYGVTASTGAMRWSCRTGMPIRSSAEIDGERAIVGSDDASIYCVNTQDGEVVWRERVWGPVRSSPTIAGGVAFIGSDDGYVYAIGVDDGKLRWRQPCGSSVQSTPDFAAGTVLVASRYGLVIAFAAHNGERLWQHAVDSPIISSPRVRGETIVLGSADGALLGLKLSDGTRSWTARYANQITSTALLGFETGYIGTVDGDCIAFQIESGELVWKHRIGGGIVSSPTYARGMLVVGSIDHHIYGISLSEHEAAELQEGQVV
jgi:outer membrane protein assembly factor BamB